MEVLYHSRMIYWEPLLEANDRAVLRLIADQRARLAVHTQHSPRRWLGSIRRQTFARAIQGSNSIEGYHASVDEAVAIIEDEPPLDERTETWYALSGYRAALTYIMQAARDPGFEFSPQLLKSLHFMMISFDLAKNPGGWRPGPVFVVSSRTEQRLYDAPDRSMVEPLVGELSDYIQRPASQDTLVKAAMAHLNLAMIHPFSDGNGRMARALQTLVLATDGLLHPVFSSIEEWLGANADEYYRVLGETGQGTWSPERSSLAWVRFCLKAHYQQASTVLRRIEEYGTLYTGIEALVKARSLNDRMAMPLFDSALGMTLTSLRYQEDAGVTAGIAQRDLRWLAGQGLLVAKGETKARRYLPGPDLAALRAAARIRRALQDPYEVVRAASAGQADLPF